MSLGTWEDRMRSLVRPKPRLDLIEVCWRVVGPSEKVIECAIFRTDVGLETRVAYSESVEELIRSEFAREIGAAREIAATWKSAAIEKRFSALDGREG